MHMRYYFTKLSSRDLIDKSLENLKLRLNCGSNIPVTVVIEGRVVFGDLISEDEYSDSVSEPNSVQCQIYDADKHNSYNENELVDDFSSRFSSCYIYLKKYSFLDSDNNGLMFDGSYLKVESKKITLITTGMPNF